MVLQNFKYNNLNLRYLSMALVMTVLVACDGGVIADQASQANNNDIINTKPTMSSTVDRSLVTRNSIDVCPRLIQKRVDSTQTVRQERISERSCDYFIYPKIGDSISVSVNNDNMKPSLIMPRHFNFANGSYRVIDNGRHVIRVEYDAISTKPDVLDFTIELTIIPAS